MTVSSLRRVAAVLVSIGFVVACSTSNDVEPGGGGATPTGAPVGAQCSVPEDCQSRVCTNGTCQAPSSKDGVKNGDETDVDCGGAGADVPRCGTGKGCAVGGDCTTGVCTNGVCGQPGIDGIKNNSETDVDCGGPGEGVPRCATGKHCEENGDCQSKICKADKTCAPASPTDGVKNGDETDVDCGGGAAPKCDVGKGCKAGGDCASNVCKDTKCVTPGANDGVKNGTETDIDCGGPDPGTPRCLPGKSCLEGADCDSLVCDPATKKCKAPSPTDGVKNGGETDVDCGGPAAGTPRCAPGLACLAHGDCASNGCAYDGKCATHPSCTKLDGGYTCGPLDSDARQEDCCASAAVGGYTVDKYQITAGRMRAFLDRFNGNIRGWAQGLPAGVWNQTYTNELPTNYNDANEQLGPYYDKRACETGNHTGHVFWTPPTANDKEDFPKDVRDRKALNCVPWWLMNAFCIWDGGHLATEAEIRAAYTNGNTTSYPWGAIGAYTTGGQNDYSVQVWGYATPNPPPTAHVDGTGYYDIAFYVAPPGRRPLGYNASGHADMVGNLLEWVSDRDRQFIWKGSWENHAQEADNYTPAPNDPYLARSPQGQPWQWGYNIGIGRPGDGRGVGYYGIGGRCAR
jgi:formylglycine-generating enzyme required for sulfatase activity